MVNNRKVTISCNIFWGFTRNIDMDYIDNEQQIIDFIVNELELFLKGNNLLNLLDKLNKIKDSYNIHGNSIENILISNPENIIYVCSH